MGLIEYIIFDSVTCCVCCVIVYFINDIKSYHKIQLIPNINNEEHENNLDNSSDKILNNEKIQLLQPIKQQPQKFIII
jgi:hypothetical protein